MSNEKSLNPNKTIVVVDFETTGVFSTETMPLITEIGAVKLNEETLEVVDSFTSLVYTKDLKLTEFITNLTGITDKMLLEEGRPLREVCKDFEKFCNGINSVLAAWPISYEVPLLQNIFYKSEYKEFPLSRRAIDIPTLFKYSCGRKITGAASLDRALEELKIEKPKERHRALADAKLEAKILIECLKYFTRIEEEAKVYRYDYNFETD